MTKAIIDLYLESDFDEYFKYDSIFISNNTQNIKKSMVTISLHRYFMKVHKQTRVLNKILLQNSNSPILISSLKASDKIFFEYVRYLEILKEIDLNYNFSKITILVDSSQLFLDIKKILGYNFIFKIDFIEKNIQLKIKYGVRFLFRSVQLFKYLEFKKKIFKKYSTLLVPFYSSQSYKNIAYLDNNESIVYPLLSGDSKFKKFDDNITSLIENKIITWSAYLDYFKNTIDNRKFLNSLNFPLSIKKVIYAYSADLAYYNAFYQSIAEKLSLKKVIGQFDSDSYIDYITMKLNEGNIKTVCIPHGVNFKYKVHYISHGVNFYTYWSKEHKKQFYENILVENCESDKIVGFYGFQILKDKYTEVQNRFKNQKKSILVIGEYFSKDDYYTSPFNYETSKRMFEKLKQYRNFFDIPITVRTRINDEFHNLSVKYEKFGIKISTPNDQDIFTDIMSHDLIISVFSNALHESLLLKKRTLQVNFLGIENYRNLADKGFVYYVTDENEFDKFMDKYMNNNLSNLDFDLHEDLYCNNALVNLELI